MTEISTPVEAELSTNPVKRYIDDMLALMRDIHNAKQEIVAHGIPFKTVNIMMELGASEKHDEQQRVIDTALKASSKDSDTATISEEKLQENLVSIISLERDLGHLRRLGKAQSLDMTAINSLTMMIRQNPDDHGEKAITDIYEYAKDCEVPLHRLSEIADSLTSGPKSVLPQITRLNPENTDQNRNRIIYDVCIGLLFTGCAMILLV